MRRLLAPTICLLALAVPSIASADDQEDRFDPEATFTTAEFMWSSGQVPASGPLRVTLDVAALQEIDIFMDGDAVFDDEASTLNTVGGVDDGELEVEFTGSVIATVSVDIEVLQTDFPLEAAAFEEAFNSTFDPYVLTGAPNRPVTLEAMLEPQTLIEQDIPTGVPFLSLNVKIDYYINATNLSYQTTRVDVHESGVDAPVSSVITNHETAVPFMPTADPGTSTDLFLATYGEYDSELEFVLVPSVSLVLDPPLINGEEWEIADQEIVVPIPLEEATPVVFTPVETQFDVPEDESPETDTGSAEESGGPGEDTGVDSLGTETGADEGSEAPSDDARDGGCSCNTTGSQRSGAWLALGLLGLGSMRRRRSGC